MTGVSVIIPTLGRPSLDVAVSSALDQSVEVEVIVVNDSGEPLLREFPEGVIVVDTEGRVGAAASRNLGMGVSSGDYLAFLDDDDFWLPGHLVAAVAFLRSHPAVDIYCAQGLVVDDLGRGRIEPVSGLGARTVRSYTYGPSALWALGRRVLTPTLVFRSCLRQHRMDPSLRVAEDTWWLLTAERAGYVVRQDDRVAAVVNGSDSRTRSRDTLERQLEWADRLDTIARGDGAAQLAVLARTAAVQGDLRTLAELVRMVAKRPGGPRWLPVLAGELAVAGLSATIRGAKRAPLAGKRDRAELVGSGTGPSARLKGERGVGVGRVSGPNGEAERAGQRLSAGQSDMVDGRTARAEKGS